MASPSPATAAPRYSAEKFVSATVVDDLEERRLVVEHHELRAREHARVAEGTQQLHGARDVAAGRRIRVGVAGVRGQRPESPYGFVAFTDKGVKHVPLDMKYGYRELLKKVVEFFDKRKAPVDMAETIEIMAFIEAALKSANNHGVGEKVTL